MRRTKAEAAETRAAVLAAAEKMFFEKGVTSSRLEDIASAAGVTRGAVYWHFASKTDLFLEVYNAVQLPLISMLDLEQAKEKGCDPLSFIEFVAQDWLELLARDKQRQRMLTILLRTNFTGEMERVQAAFDALDAEQTQTLIEIFGKAESANLLNPQWTATSAALGLKWLMKGACWEWLLTGQKYDLAEVAGLGVKTLIASFRKTPLPG
ncbi:TetR family transcriptional regulator [Rhizobium sp. SSA_523]|uniref:TetR family transcriptional regulator n=1 Tax=Rhizobium sp. SSA_523 TaxID=2952477 RepID=UPI00209139C6|nr:TetR family transcriptional regulator [Rhizobium sp. SSA_523]MCO5733390.1 TetR family transcriptional regulator [Rhizobium sp. SSA_523]WKC21635.1 TetR family transcriptional regulator [Rhizobium sp. SSA_523]